MTYNNTTCNNDTSEGYVEYRTYAHRHADIILEQRDEYKYQYIEICETLKSIKDEEIILEYDGMTRSSKKSISEPINSIIKQKLTRIGWEAESCIFADRYYQISANGRKSGTWRLDFAKNAIAVEVAFNHRSDISWNLVKPTLSAELNHVPKAIQTDIGIIVAATRSLKAVGGFDSACGTYEDYVAYLKPMYHMLTVPLLIIGLEKPKTFVIEDRQIKYIE